MSEHRGYWEELERPGPDVVSVRGRELRAGSRVRLTPRAGGDVFDIALAGRLAVIEAVEQDMDGKITLAVVLEDDPGRDLGFARQPGHRFFFAPSEIEPVEEAAAHEGRAAGAGGNVAGDEGHAAGEGGNVAGDEGHAVGEAPLATRPPRVLVAGIGNVFLGDDGFGVALADRLARRELPGSVEVIDFGIRGMDLACAMLEGYDAVVLLDATPRGQAPGTLYVIEPQIDPREVALDTHGMDPVRVLALVQALGGRPPRTLVVGCEPQTRMDGGEDEILVSLSEPVRASLEPAAELVRSLLTELLQANQTEVSSS